MIQRGVWISHGFLSHEFYVFTRRRVVKDHGDGTATFEIVGAKRRVDPKSVLRAVEEYQDWERRATEGDRPEVMS